MGGTITNLYGTVVISNAGYSASVVNNDLVVVSQGFTLGDVAYSDSYAVTVATQPTGQECVVTSGTGIMDANGVTNVGVDCDMIAYVIAGNWNRTAQRRTSIH